MRMLAVTHQSKLLKAWDVGEEGGVLLAEVGAVAIDFQTIHALTEPHRIYARTTLQATKRRKAPKERGGRVLNAPVLPQVLQEPTSSSY